MTVSNLKTYTGSKVPRMQAKSSHKGAQHTDFRVFYSRHEQPLQLFKQNFRFLARTADGDYDIGSVVEQATWQDQSSDQSVSVADLNSLTPLTGSLQLRKPSLRQYKKLLPPFLSASIDDKGRIARQGALGVVVVCQVGHGRHFVPVWAMRVVPGDGNSAEAVDLQDGTWTLNLADDLYTLAQSQQDFKFSKGRTQHRQGWRAHEITQNVCARYKIPVKRLVKGTAYFELPSSQLQSVSPLDVIKQAYEQEQKRTGKFFVIRWATPDQKHPFGALEVVPLRRNPNLLVFREQLINATLTRSQQPGFATVIEARGKLRKATGAHKNITFLAHSPRAIKRFGWVRKIVDFGSVSSELELQTIAKRALALSLTPLRTAELTHPGVATIRRGDAIRIDIPEEGYAPIALAADGTPAKPPLTGRHKSSAEALLQAEKDDPALFGLPDPNAASTTGAANNPLNTTDALNMNISAVLPVADQGIAFVTSITHTVSSGSYQIDMQTGFIDILDPLQVQEQIDEALRAAKAAKAQGILDANGAKGSRWRVTASAEDDPPGTSGACRSIQADGYSELSTVPQGTSSDFAALGHLPCLTELTITNPKTGQSTTTVKQDVGAGSSFLPVMGIYPSTRAAIGLDNSGQYEVIIQRTDGGPLAPVRGSRA